VSEFAEGGFVKRAHIERDDDLVPTFLSPGFVVVPNEVRRRLGEQVLERMHGVPTVVLSAEDLLAEG
jgi:hypothetical protein